MYSWQDLYSCLTRVLLPNSALLLILRKKKITYYIVYIMQLNRLLISFFLNNAILMCQSYFGFCNIIPLFNSQVNLMLSSFIPQISCLNISYQAIIITHIFDTENITVFEFLFCVSHFYTLSLRFRKILLIKLYNLHFIDEGTKIKEI